MKVVALHRWPRSTRSAIALQIKLAPQVHLLPIRPDVRILAGADVAFSRDGADVIAGVVVWDLQTHTVLEQRSACVPCRFPYVPGLLSFREVPGVVAAFRKLGTSPDAVLCDGQGLAHPRRMGLSCHLGLWLGIPTVGCAKSRLLGEFDEPPYGRGGAAPLWHKGAQVGVVLRTQDGVKPLFVSPGHLCDHASAVRLTLAAAIKYRLPEPTRLAHQLVSAARGQQGEDNLRPTLRPTRTAGEAPAATEHYPPISTGTRRTVLFLARSRKRTNPTGRCPDGISVSFSPAEY